MKLLYGITSSNWGGAQEYVFQIIKHELTMGNEIAIFIGEEGELTDRLKELQNIKIFNIPELVRSINPISDIKATLKIREIYKEYNPDIIHLNSSKAGAVGRIATVGLTHSKVVYTAHGWAFTEGINAVNAVIYKFVEKTLIKLTDLILCVSKYDYQLAEQSNLFKNKNVGRVIYNGANFQNNKKKIRNNIPVLVMVARFNKQKNQKLLIESLSKIDEEYILNFIGDGPTKEECVQLVNDYGLENKIKFHGFQRNIEPFLLTSDVFCLITNYEGLPISIIEAMAMKLPVVASNVGGNSELVSVDNGFLVENDVENISSALKKLLENRNLRYEMGYSSYDKYKSNFTLDNMLKLIHNEYLRLGGEKNEV